MKFAAAIEGDKSPLNGAPPPRPLTSERAGLLGPRAWLLCGDPPSSVMVPVVALPV
jgi:hypothetical protein